MDNYANFAMFFTLVIEKIGLYTNIAKENIRYGKLSQDARYKKLVESIQEKSNNNKEKICYTSTTSITLLDLQKSEDIDGQENIQLVFDIQPLKIYIVFSIKK